MSNITHSYPLITLTPANSIYTLQRKLCRSQQHVIPAEDLLSSSRMLPVHSSDDISTAYQYTKLSTLQQLCPGLPVTLVFSAPTVQQGVLDSFKCQ